MAVDLRHVLSAWRIASDLERIGDLAKNNAKRVIAIERHGDPVVSVMLWYGVGSRNEREHEAGVSHFLEHMMFKGSRQFGKGDEGQVGTDHPASGSISAPRRVMMTPRE